MNRFLLALIFFIIKAHAAIHMIGYAFHNNQLQILFVRHYSPKAKRWHYILAHNDNEIENEFRVQTAYQVDIKLCDAQSIFENNTGKIYLVRMPYKEPIQFLRNNHHSEFTGWQWVPFNEIISAMDNNFSISTLDTIEPVCSQVLKMHQLHDILKQLNNAYKSKEST